jgi:hypothetical protein
VAPDPVCSDVLHGRHQQALVTWAFIKHFIVSDDLILGFLQLDKVAELVRLACFAFCG